MATLSTVPRRRKPSTGIELSFGLSCCCVGCGAERPFPEEGRKIMSGGHQIVAEVGEPCEYCQDRRVKVSFGIGVG